MNRTNRNHLPIPSTKDSAFEIAPCRVQISPELTLALELGDFIVDKGSANPAIAALGFKLQQLVPPDKG